MGFLLREAEGASTPMLPLALGFQRNLLVTDLSLINEGPLCAGNLYVPPSSSEFFAPIEIDKNSLNHQIAKPKHGTSAEDCTEIINEITKEILISFRKNIFSAYRHASFDCWTFSKLIAAQSTFMALFGTNSVADELSFAHNAAIVQYLKDSISLDIILRRVTNMQLKEHGNNNSLSCVKSEIIKLYSHRQSTNLSLYVQPTASFVTDITNIAISIYNTTAEALFWAIFAVAKSKYVRSIIEKEADACLSLDGELNISRLHAAQATKCLTLEVIRLAPTRNIILFETKIGFKLGDNEIKAGDKLIISPHTIFRARRYFVDADEMRIGRKYNANLSGIQYLACGGKIVFRLVMLNIVLFLLDLAAAFELELVEGPSEFMAAPSFGNVRPDIKVRLNLRRSRLFR
ncbi:MAG: hypothetical protein WAK01_12475 [Methylocystis sp.]